VTAGNPSPREPVARTDGRFDLAAPAGLYEAQGRAWRDAVARPGAGFKNIASHQVTARPS
jgi:hypothetical protein